MQRFFLPIENNRERTVSYGSVYVDYAFNGQIDYTQKTVLIKFTLTHLVVGPLYTRKNN